jgi:hypothetical protein
MSGSFTRNDFLKTIPAGLGLSTMKARGADAPAGRSANRKKNLLFFFADEKSPSAGAVVPVLSWLAERSGVEFDAYICIRPKTPLGRVLALNGNGHKEQFYYLANFYDKVLYCSLTESPALQFKREAMAFGGEIISTRKPNELVDFYRDVFSYFKAVFPEELVVLPSRPQAADRLWLQPYCYPDVYFRQALAISEDALGSDIKRLRSAGAKRVSMLYCSDAAVELARQAKLDVKTIDSIRPDDTYASVSCRIADRSIQRAKGIAFADPYCTLKWQAYNLREGLLTLYEPTQWKPFVKTIARYAKQTGNNLITGNQMVVPVSDNVITEFSKEGLVMSLAGLDARIGTTMQTRKRLPLDWLRDIRPPWEEAASDEFLTEQARLGRIPVCFILYAADLGHLPAFNRLLDLMTMEDIKCGLAFPSTWYDFQAELLEQLYIPVDLGGVYPNVEPMVVSAGTGVATEAEGYLKASELGSALQAARRSIASHVGERLVPIGYYSFQDACPDYKCKTARPLFQPIKQAGFQYSFTHQDENEAPHVVHEDGKFMALNQQSTHWWYGRMKFSFVEKLQSWEEQLTKGGQKGWITLALDFPYFGLPPSYLRELGRLAEVMAYAASGGASKKLFLAKPHEVVRYAKILRNRRGAQ